VECYINEDVFWSDGTAITAKDVLATYKIIQNTSVNPSVKQILDNTTISSQDNAIVFENETRDVNFMNALFQPIVSEKILTSLGEKELS
jgi:ABC-type transport system substrate-binding protein